MSSVSHHTEPLVKTLEDIAGNSKGNSPSHFPLACFSCSKALGQDISHYRLLLDPSARDTSSPSGCELLLFLFHPLEKEGLAHTRVPHAEDVHLLWLQRTSLQKF